MSRWVVSGKHTVLDLTSFLFQLSHLCPLLRNGEFEIATASDDNLVIRNNQLYIIPTLTSDEIGTSAIFSGSYDLGSACTVGSDQSTFIGGSSGGNNCSVTASPGSTVVPPVKSARISTKGHYSIAYGRVEVRAKLPTGDWLWPAIWMLPENNTYGGWPLSGEIDVSTLSFTESHLA